MGNHFHLLVQMFPEPHFEDEEIRKRCKAHYGEDFELSDEQIDNYRDKLSSLANYMKEIKQAFSWYYNQRHNRRGTLWGERFKSVIVEKEKIGTGSLCLTLEILSYIVNTQHPIKSWNE